MHVSEEWRHNKWRNRYGRPIENDDLWKRVLSSFEGGSRIRIDFQWKKGKKSPILKAVDAVRRERPVNLGEAWLRVQWWEGGAFKSKGRKDTSTLFTASGQDAVIMCIAGSDLGGEGRVYFDVYYSRKSGSSRRSALRTLASTLPPIFTGGMCIGFGSTTTLDIRSLRRSGEKFRKTHCSRLRKHNA